MWIKTYKLSHLQILLLQLCLPGRVFTKPREFVESRRYPLCSFYQVLVNDLIVNDVFSWFTMFNLMNLFLLKSNGQEDVLGSWCFFLGGRFLWLFICWQVLKLDVSYHSR